MILRNILILNNNKKNYKIRTRDRTLQSKIYHQIRDHATRAQSNITIHCMQFIYRINPNLLTIYTILMPQGHKKPQVQGQVRSISYLSRARRPLRPQNTMLAWCGLLWSCVPLGLIVFDKRYFLVQNIFILGKYFQLYFAKYGYK